MSKDHVHLLVSCPPGLIGQGDAVLEGWIASAADEFPQLKKQWWSRHLWARGITCAKVGEVTEEMSLERLPGLSR